MTEPQGALLTGSVNFDDAEKTMRTVAEILGAPRIAERFSEVTAGSRPFSTQRRTVSSLTPSSSAASAIR